MPYLLLQHRLLMAFIIILVASCALADPNDWVNVDYVIWQTPKGSSNGLLSSTANARATIIRSADTMADKGPWSVVNSEGVLPPSQNPHDYLSWAPYHWPECDWCNPTGRTHMAHNGEGSGNALPMELSRGDLNFTPTSLSNLQTKPTVEQGISSLLISVPTTVTTFNTLNLFPSPSLSPIAASNTRSAGPVQAVAKTTKTSCTPSPTKSLAPSATWTACNYVSRDGSVNPDVRTLTGPNAINDVAQTVLYNALQRNTKYSKNVANRVETFFVNSSTKMNPNVNFGQIVRGPGEKGRIGTFTGILDLRGVVKSKENDEALVSWFSEYMTWLSNSDLGKMTASRPNNHATFYTSQIAAAKFFTGDREGAIADLEHFCSTTFLDQVAKTGEQPFEAARTRPFHYRCFNLEALITNAKLADQMGVDLWSCKSKYGATIQTALDFLMTINPGIEDKSQLNPHVAAISAAYGDATGKYTAFLKKREPDYQSKPYWFYDQTTALTTASALSQKSRSVIWKRETPLLLSTPADNVPVSEVDVPFECPAVFQDATEVEIDDGVYVTCDQLRPFYV